MSSSSGSIKVTVAFSAGRVAASADSGGSMGGAGVDTHPSRIMMHSSDMKSLCIQMGAFVEVHPPQPQPVDGASAGVTAPSIVLRAWQSRKVAPGTTVMHRMWSPNFPAFDISSSAATSSGSKQTARVKVSTVDMHQLLLMQPCDQLHVAIASVGSGSSSSGQFQRQQLQLHGMNAVEWSNLLRVMLQSIPVHPQLQISVAHYSTFITIKVRFQRILTHAHTYARVRALID